MRILAAALATLIVATPFAAMAEEGDAKKGKKAYRKCRACHVADKEKNRVGPHLVGIVGRKAASIEGYKYSKAMIAKGEEGLMWTDENFLKYMENPKGFVPGTKMVFKGFKEEADRVNLLAYLKSLAPKTE